MKPKLKGNLSPSWKGGRTVMGPDQYIGLFLPQHPRANKNGYVREHIVIAESALGKALPKTAIIHHVDENQANNRNDNLVICQDIAYHKLLHVRMRVRQAGGNPDLHKICGGCKVPVLKTDFNKLRRASDGLHFWCKACGRVRARLAYVRRRGL